MKQHFPKEKEKPGMDMTLPNNRKNLIPQLGAKYNLPSCP